MTLLLDAGVGPVVAGDEVEAGALGRNGPSPATWAATRERSRTLDDVLSGAWEGLSAAASTDCPVCHGELEPRWSAGAGVVGGRCRDCGSELG